jgi:hypothetical protein
LIVTLRVNILRSFVDELLGSDGLEDTRRAEKASELDSIRTELITSKCLAMFNIEPMENDIPSTRFSRYAGSKVNSNPGGIGLYLSFLIYDSQSYSALPPIVSVGHLGRVNLS